MSILDIFPPSHASINYVASSKAELIRDLATRLCGVVGVDPVDCVRLLLERETLGSTGIGGGTAIPHARLQSLREPIGFVVRLRRPIHFDAIDGRDVSLVGLLLLPASDSAAASAALAKVAKRFRDQGSLERLRNAVSNASFHTAFVKELSVQTSGGGG